MLHVFFKSQMSKAIFFAAIWWGSSIRDSDSMTTEQTDKENWLCARGCSGVLGADHAKRNVAEASQQNGFAHAFYKQWSVLSQFFCSSATKNVTGGQFCQKQ